MAATPLTRLLFTEQWDSNPAPTVIGALLTCDVLWYFLQTIIGGSCRIIQAVDFGFFVQNFGRWWGPTNGTNLVILWMQLQLWRDSKVVGNFLHSQVVVMIKRYSCTCPHPCACLHSRATLWNFVTTFSCQLCHRRAISRHTWHRYADFRCKQVLPWTPPVWTCPNIDTTSVNIDTTSVNMP